MDMNVDHSFHGSKNQGGGGGFMGSSTPVLVGAAVGGAMGFMMPMAGTVMGLAGGAYVANKVKCAFTDCGKKGPASAVPNPFSFDSH
mmetsp:Transcript_144699/g.252229  ORF Transcript_144699/g.252229 Transcript_144699/m.252229 type:complete len:87 (-) Transcript_144699:1087-1347(-)